MHVVRQSEEDAQHHGQRQKKIGKLISVTQAKQAV
jgi:hypothetical protein